MPNEKPAKPAPVAIKDEFRVHLLNEQGLAKAAKLAEAFSQFLETVDGLIPQSRERSIFVTKLQEASFFAKRALAVVPENQQQPTEKKG